MFISKKLLIIASLLCWLPIQGMFIPTASEYPTLGVLFAPPPVYAPALFERAHSAIQASAPIEEIEQLVAQALNTTRSTEREQPREQFIATKNVIRAYLEIYGTASIGTSLRMTRIHVLIALFKHYPHLYDSFCSNKEPSVALIEHWGQEIMGYAQPLFMPVPIHYVGALVARYLAALTHYQQQLSPAARSQLIGMRILNQSLAQMSMLMSLDVAIPQPTQTGTTSTQTESLVPAPGISQTQLAELAAEQLPSPVLLRILQERGCSTERYVYKHESISEDRAQEELALAQEQADAQALEAISTAQTVLNPDHALFCSPKTPQEQLVALIETIDRIQHSENEFVRTQAHAIICKLTTWAQTDSIAECIERLVDQHIAHTIKAPDKKLSESVCARALHIVNDRLYESSTPARLIIDRIEKNKYCPPYLLGRIREQIHQRPVSALQEFLKAYQQNKKNAIARRELVRLYATGLELSETKERETLTHTLCAVLQKASAQTPGYLPALERNHRELFAFLMPSFSEDNFVRCEKIHRILNQLIATNEERARDLITGLIPACQAIIASQLETGSMYYPCNPGCAVRILEPLVETNARARELCAQITLRHHERTREWLFPVDQFFKLLNTMASVDNSLWACKELGQLIEQSIPTFEQEAQQKKAREQAIITYTRAVKLGDHCCARKLGQLYLADGSLTQAAHAFEYAIQNVKDHETERDKLLLWIISCNRAQHIDKIQPLTDALCTLIKTPYFTLDTIFGDTELCTAWRTMIKQFITQFNKLNQARGIPAEEQESSLSHRVATAVVQDHARTESKKSLNKLEETLKEKDWSLEKLADALGLDIKIEVSAHQPFAHYAATHGMAEDLEFLIQQEGRALLLVKDSDGNTPLHLAAIHRQNEIIALLIQDSSIITQMEAINNEKRTPLDEAIHANSNRIEAMIISYCAHCREVLRDESKVINSALRTALKLRSCEIAHMLLNDWDADVHTILPACKALAAKEPQNVFAQLVIAYAELKNPVNVNVPYALHQVIATGAPDFAIERMLSKKRSLAQEVDENGDTPLHIATRMGRITIAQTLLENCGCNPTAINNAQQDCLCIAMDTRNTRLFSLLAHAGMSRSEWKENAQQLVDQFAFCAARDGRIDDLRVAIELHASLRTKNTLTQESALDAAKNNGHQEIVSLINHVEKTRREQEKKQEELRENQAVIQEQIARMNRLAALKLKRDQKQGKKK